MNGVAHPVQPTSARELAFTEQLYADEHILLTTSLGFICP